MSLHASVSVRQARGVQSCLDPRRRAAAIRASRHYLRRQCAPMPQQPPPPPVTMHYPDPPVEPALPACPPSLSSCKPHFAKTCDFVPGSCFKHERCPTFTTLLHNYVLYSELLFTQVKYGDEARREATISHLQLIVEQFNNLLGPDFQTIFEPVTQAIVEMADARLGKGDPQDRQLLNDDAMDKLHALSSTLGFYFGSMAPQNPRLCHDEKLLCCIRDGWGAIVNLILEMTYSLQEEGRDAAAFNNAVENIHKAATLFGQFLDSLCLKPKPPCPKGVTVFDDSRRALNIEQDAVNESGVAARAVSSQTTTMSPDDEIEQSNNRAPATIGELMDDYGDLFSENIGKSLHDILSEQGCVQKAIMETKPAIAPFSNITKGVQQYTEGQSPYKSSYEFVSFKIYDNRNPAEPTLLREVLSDDEDRHSISFPKDSNVRMGRVTLLMRDEAISGTLFTLDTSGRIPTANGKNAYTLVVRDEKNDIQLSDILVQISLVWNYELKNGQKETAQITLLVNGTEMKASEKANNHYQTKQPLITRNGDVYAIITRINFIEATSAWKQVSVDSIHVFAVDPNKKEAFLEFYRRHVTEGKRVPVQFGRVVSAPSMSNSAIGAELLKEGQVSLTEPVLFSPVPKKAPELKARYRTPVGSITDTISQRDTKVRRAVLSGKIEVEGGDRPLLDVKNLPVLIGRYEGPGGVAGDKLLFLNQIGAMDRKTPFLEFRIKGRIVLNVDLRLDVNEEDQRGQLQGAQQRSTGRSVQLNQQSYGVYAQFVLTSNAVDEADGKFQSASQQTEDGRRYVVRLAVSQNAADKELHGEIDTNLYGIGAVAFLVADNRRRV